MSSPSFFFSHDETAEPGEAHPQPTLRPWYEVAICSVSVSSSLRSAVGPIASLLTAGRLTGLSQKLIISYFCLGSHARTQAWWIFRPDDDLLMGKQTHNYLLF